MIWPAVLLITAGAWTVYAEFTGTYAHPSVWGYFAPPLLQRIPPQPLGTPLDAMVDLTNNLGVAILQDHSYSRGNFAFSPYGVASVLVVLYEGARGESAYQIYRAVGFPPDKDVIRIGFRNIHRHLRSYFSHEGYLSGITMNKKESSLLPEYKQILRFYGYDVDAEEEAGNTGVNSTTSAVSTTTEISEAAAQKTPKPINTTLEECQTIKPEIEESPEVLLTTTTEKEQEEMVSKINKQDTPVNENEGGGEDSATNQNPTTKTTVQKEKKENEAEQNQTTTAVEKEKEESTTKMATVKEKEQKEESTTKITAVEEKKEESTTKSTTVEEEKEENALAQNPTTIVIEEDKGENVGYQNKSTTAILEKEKEDNAADKIQTTAVPKEENKEKEKEEGGGGEEDEDLVDQILTTTTPNEKEKEEEKEGGGGEEEEEEEDLVDLILTSTIPNEKEEEEKWGEKEEEEEYLVDLILTTTTPNDKENEEEKQQNEGIEKEKEGEEEKEDNAADKIQTTAVPKEENKEKEKEEGRGGEEDEDLVDLILTTTTPNEKEKEEEKEGGGGEEEEEDLVDLILTSTTPNEKEEEEKWGEKEEEEDLVDLILTSTTPNDKENEEEKQQNEGIEKEKEGEEGKKKDVVDRIQSTTETVEKEAEKVENEEVKPDEKEGEKEEGEGFVGETVSQTGATVTEVVPTEPGFLLELDLDEQGEKSLVNKKPNVANSDLDNGMLIPQPGDGQPTAETPIGETNTKESEMTSQSSTETTTQGLSNLRQRRAVSPETVKTKNLGAVSMGVRACIQSRRKRTIIDYLKRPMSSDLSLQLQNGMYDSHVSRNKDMYRSLPKLAFLVDGSIDTPVPMMTYTNVFPFAYIPRLHSKALEFPLDDIRYKLLILLPIERRGLRQLIYDLTYYPLSEVLRALRPLRVKATVPTFMVEGFVILTSSLQKLGIWDVFDSRKSNLSGMSIDPELYVRNVEQSVTVVIRNYVEILDIQTRTMAGRNMEGEFTVSHPFLYFVMDTATNVALMAGQMLDPLNSRIY